LNWKESEKKAKYSLLYQQVNFFSFSLIETGRGLKSVKGREGYFKLILS